MIRRADDWVPCSTGSLSRDDPLIGTAGRGERWFLIEIDGSWGSHAILESRLDSEVAGALVARIERAGIRPLAIRRTGRRADQRRARSTYSWALVDARPGRESVRWGSVADPAELLDVALDGSAGTASDEPIICVCTHARHDQCCAVRGRPAVTAFARAYPDLTWECSHLGGDRFAATMIIFPEALMFGRVDDTDPLALYDRYRQGRIDQRHYRGRAALTNVVQAAQAFAVQRSGDDRIGAYPPIAERPCDDGWIVELDHDHQPLVVEVGARPSEPLLSTCRATHPVAVREFRLISIEPFSIEPST